MTATITTLLLLSVLVFFPLPTRAQTDCSSLGTADAISRCFESERADAVQRCQSLGSADAIERCINDANNTGSGEGSTSAAEPVSSDEGGTERESFSNGECSPGAGEQLSADNCGIIRIVVNVINFLSAVAGIVLVVSLMISGYLYMTARDNAGQVEKAKSRIIQTLIALALFIFMYALLNFLIPGGLGLA